MVIFLALDFCCSSRHLTQVPSGRVAKPWMLQMPGEPEAMVSQWAD